MQIDVAAHGPQGFGLPIPSQFGVIRGYLRVGKISTKGQTDRPAGLSATLELAADGLQSAEQESLQIGRTLATLTSHFFGSPERVPRLLRIAEVDVDGRLQTQSDYYYDDSPFPTVGFESSELGAYLERNAKLPEPARSAV